MFFVLEGPNGCGKSTVLKHLSARGYDCFESPGGTPLAKHLRAACRGTSPWEACDARTRFLLFSAARQDEFHLRVKGMPHTVIAGRWWTSTYVYQSLYQGLDVNMLEATIDPDERITAVILLTAPESVLVERVRKEREANPGHGRCAWTKKFEETLKQLLPYYEDALPRYMAARWEVPTLRVSTETLGPLQVADEVEAIINMPRIEGQRENGSVCEWVWDAVRGAFVTSCPAGRVEFRKHERHACPSCGRKVEVKKVGKE